MNGIEILQYFGTALSFVVCGIFGLTKVIRDSNASQKISPQQKIKKCLIIRICAILLFMSAAGIIALYCIGYHNTYEDLNWQRTESGNYISEISKNRSCTVISLSEKMFQSADSIFEQEKKRYANKGFDVCYNKFSKRNERQLQKIMRNFIQKVPVNYDARNFFSLIITDTRSKHAGIELYIFAYSATADSKVSVIPAENKYVWAVYKNCGKIISQIRLREASKGVEK